MMSAIRAARNRGAAIAEVGTGGVAERPAAHRFFQLDDRHPERHRQDHALEGLGLGFDRRMRLDRHRGRSPDDPPCNRGRARRRRGALRPRLRRGRARSGSGRARRLRSASETEPVNLSDDRVAGQPMAERAGDVARALALDPELPKLLHSFIRPGHRRLVLSIPSGLECDPHAESLPAPDYAHRRVRREPTLYLKSRPRDVVAIFEKTTLAVESRAIVRRGATCGFSTGLNAEWLHGCQTTSGTGPVATLKTVPPG